MYIEIYPATVISNKKWCYRLVWSRGIPWMPYKPKDKCTVKQLLYANKRGSNRLRMFLRIA